MNKKREENFYKLSEDGLSFLKDELKEAQAKLDIGEDLAEYSEGYDLSNPEEIYEDILVKLSFELTKLREKKGWSQAKLAKRAKKTQPKISKIENLTSDNPKIETLVDIFFALGKTLYITPHKEYTYTVPEKQRSDVNEIASKTGLSTNEIIANSFEKGFTFYDVPISDYTNISHPDIVYSEKNEIITDTDNLSTPSIVQPEEWDTIDISNEEFNFDFLDLNGEAQ